jgi:hypothetical protein
MTRQTSIDTYHAIESEGLLSKRRWEVYQALYHVGPATAGEVAQSSGSVRNFSVGDNTHARIGELVERGVVREVGERECRVSGRMCIVWDVTEHLPVEPPKKEVKSKKDKRAVMILTQIKQTVSGAFLGPELTLKIEEYLR